MYLGAKVINIDRITGYDILMIMKQRLNKTLQPYKFKIYNELWEKYKGQLAMEDLAKILNTPLSSYYRIIRKNYEPTKHN